MHLTNHFTSDEMACGCCGRSNMNLAFMTMLEKLRVKWGHPIIVTSAFRCQAKNISLKTVPNSKHIYGRAVDIAMGSSNDRYHFIKLALEEGFCGIGIGKGFIHIDNRVLHKARMWHYY